MTRFSPSAVVALDTGGTKVGAVPEGAVVGPMLDVVSLGRWPLPADGAERIASQDFGAQFLPAGQTVPAFALTDGWAFDVRLVAAVHG